MIWPSPNGDASPGLPAANGTVTLPNNEFVSTDCVTPDALSAREHGYEVHQDNRGWYVVKPHEWRDERGRNKRGSA